MLGRKIFDPDSVESAQGEMDGLGLLDIDTVFDATKTTCQVEAEAVPGSMFFAKSKEDERTLHGYEIHMGESTGDLSLFAVKRLSGPQTRQARHTAPLLDGSVRGNCWGTYLHGIFENDAFRREVLNRLREKKGLPPLAASVSYARTRDQALDRLATIVREGVDMAFVRRILSL
jgi:adenosylcobyric acid synthase